MQDQKLENLLNLALDATPQEREKSLVLDVGFEPEERRWDLIVKYSGSSGQWSCWVVLPSSLYRKAGSKALRSILR